MGDDASFVVVLGDDIVDPDSDFLERMIDAHESSGRPVVALMEVPEAGRLQVRDRRHRARRTRPASCAITGLVEKPARADAPSNLAIIGRYVLPGAIFPVLADTPPGAGGEIQLTDALQTMAAGRADRGRASSTRCATTPATSSAS